MISNTFIVQLMPTTCEACVLCTHASQVLLCNHNTDNVYTTSMYSHWTEGLILAKHWLWLPDDGFIVNRNMLQQSPLF